MAIKVVLQPVLGGQRSPWLVLTLVVLPSGNITFNSEVFGVAEIIKRFLLVKFESVLSINWLIGIIVFFIALSRASKSTNVLPFWLYTVGTRYNV